MKILILRNEIGKEFP